MAYYRARAFSEEVKGFRSFLCFVGRSEGCRWDGLIIPSTVGWGRRKNGDAKRRFLFLCVVCKGGRETMTHQDGCDVTPKVVHRKRKWITRDDD